MTLLMNFDEIEKQLDFRQYHMDAVSLKKNITEKGVSFILSVPGLTEGRPSLMVDDSSH